MHFLDGFAMHFIHPNLHLSLAELNLDFWRRMPPNTQSCLPVRLHVCLFKLACREVLLTDN